MGLFSSKSSAQNISTTTVDEQANTVGDLSSGNVMATGGSTIVGMAGNDLSSFLTYNDNLLSNFLNSVETLFKTSASSADSARESAVTEVAELAKEGIANASQTGQITNQYVRILIPIVLIVGITILGVTWVKGK